MRIDAHVHAFPERLALRVRAALNGSGRLTASPLLADVAASVRDGGFDTAWILPYAHRPGIAAGLNEWSAREVTQYPWLVAGATFHPGDEDLPELARTAFEVQHLRVVKLHCAVGQFAVSDPALAPLWELAAAFRVPVVAHAGHASPGETAANEIRDEVADVLRRNPGVTLVLAHAGAPSVAETVRLMDEFPNLYADLTPIMDRRIEPGVDALERLAGRFLFGSDAPNNPHSATTLAAEVAALPLSTAARDAILGGAAKTLT